MKHVLEITMCKLADVALIELILQADAKAVHLVQPDLVPAAPLPIRLLHYQVVQTSLGYELSHQKNNSTFWKII